MYEFQLTCSFAFISLFCAIETGNALICMISSQVRCSFDKFSERSGNIDTCTSAATEGLRVVDSLREREDVCRLNVFVSVVVVRIRFTVAINKMSNKLIMLVLPNI